MSDLSTVTVTVDGGDDEGEVIVARVAGELDLSNAAAVGEQLASAVPNRALGLAVDMTATTYLDSSGVSLMFDLAERLRRRQQQLRLVVPEDAPLRRVLRIVAPDDALRVVATVDEASQQIRAAA